MRSELIREDKYIKEKNMATSKKINHALKGKRVLNDKSVMSIRKDYETGKLTARELSEKHEVSTTTIFHILNRITWKHI